MVLSDLSRRLTGSLRKFAHVGRGGQQGFEAEIDTFLGEIGDALVESDVSVPYVLDLKKKIRADVLDEAVIERQTGVKGGFGKLGGNQKQRVHFLKHQTLFPPE